MKGRGGDAPGQRGIPWTRQAEDVDVDWRPMANSEDAEEDATGQRRILWRRQAKDEKVNSAGEAVVMEPDWRQLEISENAEDGGFGGTVHQREICWVRWRWR